MPACAYASASATCSPISATRCHGRRPTRGNLGAQGAARDKLHHDPRRTVELHDVVDGDHVRMVQPGGRKRFPHGTGNDLGALAGGTWYGSSTSLTATSRPSVWS